MSTAVKEREFRDVVAAAEGMVRDIKARSYNRKPRYLKERPVIRDNSPNKNRKFTALTAEQSINLSMSLLLIGNIHLYAEYIAEFPQEANHLFEKSEWKRTVRRV